VLGAAVRPGDSQSASLGSCQTCKSKAEHVCKKDG
jgi:hypothetical protein